MVVFCLMCRWLFRSAFVYDPERVESVMTLNEREAIKDKPLLVKSLVGAGPGGARRSCCTRCCTTSPRSSRSSAPGLLVLVTDVTTDEALADVEWPTLVFFAGLFIMVGSLVETGVIGDLSEAMADATGGRARAWPPMLLLGGSAVLSAIVDNIPYVATMSPVVTDLVQGHGSTTARCSGGRSRSERTSAATPPRSAPRPTSSMLGLAERAGHRIGFWEFTKYGLVVTVVTVGLTAPYLWLRYL